MENVLFPASDRERSVYTGQVAEMFSFLVKEQGLNKELWVRFVNQFRIHGDAHGGWRGEYWGKMMRGCAMMQAVLHDDELYAALREAVVDLLSVQEENGRVSTYDVEYEFTNWDMWSRKYVMLGMMYFLEICPERALKKKIVTFLTAHADYILDRVGEGEGKTPITKTSDIWGGMNSCSILEPMVRLYTLTGEKRYLDFSKYIIDTGFTDFGNIIDLALADEVSPYQYPVVKAYEMMSCFEGLLKYYYVTGEEKWRDAVVKFTRRVMNDELSVIGCSGCTHELFDHTVVKQTQTGYAGIVQETCVAVTWMKLCGSMLELTGDKKYADCIEQTFFNNYLGAFNFDGAMMYYTSRQSDKYKGYLPIDSYAPLTSAMRGQKVGGFQYMPEDQAFYSCCTCIAAAGLGTYGTHALMKSKDGFVLEIPSDAVHTVQTPKHRDAVITVSGNYPYAGEVTVKLNLTRGETFTLAVRVPAWCRKATCRIGGRGYRAENDCFVLQRLWHDGDTVTLSFAMPVERVLPPEGALHPNLFNAFRKGPVVLAADRRIADADKEYDVDVKRDGTVAFEAVDCPEIRCNLSLLLPLKNGEKLHLIDYGSAGKTNKEDSRMAAWLYRY